MDRDEPASRTMVAPPDAAGPRTPMRVRRGLLAIVAAAAAVTSVVALNGMTGGTAAAPAPAAPTPKISLAAAEQGAAQALQALGQAPVAQPQAAAAASSSGVQVTIQNYAFSPSTLTIPAGTTVVWTNKDTAPHTVTVSDGPVKFASPNLNTGDTFTYTFTQAGTYQYYCAVHPDMKASVTVTGSTAPPPTTTPPVTTTAPPTTTMSMPPPPSGSGGACLVSGVLTPLIQHVNSAHLGESPAQQVQDLLNLNQYVQTHTVLIENMLNPLTNGGLMNVLNGILTPLVQHVNSAHLGESPAQQVQDLLNVSQYVQTHTVLIENMLAPLEQAAC
ncbi:MAG TPA: cupredoxin family copper-binding protein [Pseudonocardiaceae bacterium]